jgi:hypothetical protein
MQKNIYISTFNIAFVSVCVLGCVYMLIKYLNETLRRIQIWTYANYKIDEEIKFEWSNITNIHKNN